MKSPARLVGKRAICTGCKAELIVPKARTVQPLRESADQPKQSKPPSEIETGDFEAEAEAIRRELDGGEPVG
jgi:hypothetical protein